MLIGIAADHGGFALKERVLESLRAAEYEVKDFGAFKLESDDDFVDFVAPLARAVSLGEVHRGIAICGSGVGACVAANKVPGARACLIVDIYSAHQGVEDDDMNILCLGGRVTGYELAWDLIQAFLSAHYLALERFQRRLKKIAALESGESNK
ncbi:MAG: RpiB/LacA/LacB family sugar-phosphate isomerase [Anaerolineaceae bacterium]|nr:RpiB/LacA/LacB family sugar-phosphate isomerase [Anaerolineaceae bacterium]